MSTPERLLELAADELTYAEFPPGSNRTKFAAVAGHLNGYPWCATFVAAIAKQAGVALPSTSAYTPHMVDAFRKAGRWHHEPRVGDLVFFDFNPGGDAVEHVGFVERIAPDGALTTIEGNTSPGAIGSQDNGGGVYRRVRSRKHVVGFGRPSWSEEESMAIKELEVEIDDKTGHGNAVLYGVSPDRVRGLIPIVDHKGGMKDVVVKFGLHEKPAQNGDAIINADLGSPGLVDITVRVKVAYV